MKFFIVGDLIDPKTGKSLHVDPLESPTTASAYQVLYGPPMSNQENKINPIIPVSVLALGVVTGIVLLLVHKFKKNVKKAEKELDLNENRGNPKLYGVPNNIATKVRDENREPRCLYGPPSMLNRNVSNNENDKEKFKGIKMSEEEVNGLVPNPEFVKNVDMAKYEEAVKEAYTYNGVVMEVYKNYAILYTQRIAPELYGIVNDWINKEPIKDADTKFGEYSLNMILALRPGEKILQAILLLSDYIKDPEKGKAKILSPKKDL